MCPENLNLWGETFFFFSFSSKTEIRDGLIVSLRNIYALTVKEVFNSQEKKKKRGGKKKGLWVKTAFGVVLIKSNRSLTTVSWLAILGLSQAYLGCGTWKLVIVSCSERLHQSDFPETDGEVIWCSLWIVTCRVYLWSEFYFTVALETKS